MTAHPNGKTVTVVGMISDSDWDARDHVTEVTLTTDEDEEYVIRNRKIVRKLEEYLDEYVEVKGMETETEEKLPMLIVESFKSINHKEEKPSVVPEPLKWLDQDWCEEDSEDLDLEEGADWAVSTWQRELEEEKFYRKVCGNDQRDSRPSV